MPEEPDGWFNPKTGNWDKPEPDLPSFMEQEQ